MNDIRRVISYNDVLLVPRYSDCDHLSDANINYDYSSFKSLPVINAPMDKVVSPEMLNILHNQFNMSVTIHRWFDLVLEQVKFYNECLFMDDHGVFLSVGIKAKWEQWITELLDYRTKYNLNFGILIDIANGDNKACVDTIKFIKEYNIKPIDIMAGNIATKSAFERLQDAGANFIRGGVGSGACCSTRTEIGYGVPTLTIINDCAKVKNSAYLIADGGVEYNGDIVKAIGAGADMVMCGKMFCATNLSPANKLNKYKEITDDENEFCYVEYSGMASKEAISKLNSKKSFISIEGVSGLIKYKGKTVDVINEMIGNLKSAMAYYGGCRNWKEFQRKIKFQEITHNGWQESLTRVIDKD